MTRLRSALATAALIALARSATAQSAAPTPSAAPENTSPPPLEAPPGEESGPSVALRRNEEVRRRPIGSGELGVSLLALPDAAICVERLSGCKTGDASPLLEAWQLYQPVPRFSFGAGLTLGLTATANAPRRDPAGFEREHDRRYFSLELVGRYTIVDGDALDFWGGITTGLAVVSDSFTSKSVSGGDPALVGPRSDTIRTEGFALGIALGLAYSFAPRWTLGGALRSGSWFFPSPPNENRVGDTGSLAGRVNVLTLGLSVGYSVPL